MRIDRIDRHIHTRVYLHFDLHGNKQVAGTAGSEKRMAVEETRNPYTPPKSEMSIPPEKLGPGVGKVFSPAQSTLGALLGGPLAGTYFVCTNFLVLGKRTRAWLAAIVGTAIAAATTVWNLSVSDTMAYYGIAISCVPALIVWPVVVVAQFTKTQILKSTTITFHSNRRVAAVVLLGLVTFATMGPVVGHFLPHR